MGAPQPRCYLECLLTQEACGKANEVDAVLFCENEVSNKRVSAASQGLSNCSPQRQCGGKVAVGSNCAAFVATGTCGSGVIDLARYEARMMDDGWWMMDCG